jgi:hypothetical protein
MLDNEKSSTYQKVSISVEGFRVFCCLHKYVGSTTRIRSRFKLQHRQIPNVFVSGNSRALRGPECGPSIDSGFDGAILTTWRSLGPAVRQILYEPSS